MINWIKNNIKTALKCADMVNPESDMAYDEGFHRGYVQAMREVLDEVEDLKVDIGGEILPIERIDMNQEYIDDNGDLEIGNILVISTSSLGRRFRNVLKTV